MCPAVSTSHTPWPTTGEHMTAMVLQPELPLERPVHRLDALAQPGGAHPWGRLIAAAAKHSGNAQLGHVGGEGGPGEPCAAHQHQVGTPVEAVVGFVHAVHGPIRPEWSGTLSGVSR